MALAGGVQVNAENDLKRQEMVGVLNEFTVHGGSMQHEESSADLRNLLPLNLTASTVISSIIIKLHQHPHHRHAEAVERVGRHALSNGQ